MFWGGAGINCAFKTVQKLVRMGVDLYPFEVTQGKSVLVLMIWGGADVVVWLQNKGEISKDGKIWKILNRVKSYSLKRLLD